MNNNEFKIKIKKALESIKFKTVICILGILAVILLVFQAGMIAGFRKASFGHDWGEHYSQNFGFPNMGPGMMRGGFGNLPNAHGAIGKIIKVSLPTIIVLDEKDNTEKSVLIGEGTEIRKVKESIDEDQLKVDDHVVVIGSPNSSGQIEAKLIRFLPFPLEMPTMVN